MAPLAHRHLAGTRAARTGGRVDGRDRAVRPRSRFSASVSDIRRWAPPSAASVVRARQLMHGKSSSIEHDGRGLFAGLRGPFAAARYHSLIVADDDWPDESRGHGADGGRSHGDGAAASRVADAWRAVPSRVGAHDRRPADVAQLPGDVMFPALLEKLQRREDLTADEAAVGAWRASWTATRAAAQIGGLLVGLRQKGERPAELVGFARTMRERAVPLSRRYPEALRHLRHRRRRRGDVQHLVRRCAGRRRLRPARREARQSIGVEPLRQRRCVRSARRQRRGAAATVERCLVRSGHRVLLRPDLPPVDALRRARSTRPRRADGVQPARPADQPRRGVPSAGRRATSRAHRAGGTRARSAGIRPASGSCTAPMASTRSRRPATRKYPRPATAACGPSTSTPADFGLPKAKSADLRGGDAAANADRLRRILAGEPGPARDIVLFNAGAALLIGGLVESVGDGIRLAATALDAGRAAERLERLVQVSADEGSGV